MSHNYGTSHWKELLWSNFCKSLATNLWKILIGSPSLGNLRNVGNNLIKCQTFFFGWQKTVKNYATQASLEDLQEVKDSLQKLVIKDGKYGEDPVHEATKIGAVKFMEFLMKGYGQTALHWACRNGNTETAKLIIQSSKDFRIDLKANDNRGDTARIDAS